MVERQLQLTAATAHGGNRTARPSPGLYDGPMVDSVALQLSRYGSSSDYERPHAALASRTPNECLVHPRGWLVLSAKCSEPVHGLETAPYTAVRSTATEGETSKRTNSRSGGVWGAPSTIRISGLQTGHTVSTDATQEPLDEFVLRVVQIERRYAHRLRGVRNARREAIRDVMEEYGPATLTTTDADDSDER